jgi:hypothetical protein
MEEVKDAQKEVDIQYCLKESATKVMVWGR